ncbi:MAG: NAD-dependent deacylase [Pyrinomonadaceae bacterium]
MAKESLIRESTVERVRSAKNVFALTGAGVSAESGVPTFRGGGGATVWKGMPFDVISSAQMVERDLAAVWEWFDYRRGVLRELKPNAAHTTLAEWEEKFNDFTLATQNIDGLHAAAGLKDVLELHGTIWQARCLACDRSKSLRDERGGEQPQRPPVCGTCGGEMRPDVVLFGEMLPANVLERAAEAAERCDVCFVIGTSGVVYPAAGLAEIAKRAGAYVIEINPERTALSDLCDETIKGQAGEILPRFQI